MEVDSNDETLGGFIVEDGEIETSDGRILRNSKQEIKHEMNEKQEEQNEGGVYIFIIYQKNFSLNWLISTFLPAFVDEPFQIILGDFLLKPLNYRDKFVQV